MKITDGAGNVTEFGYDPDTGRQVWVKNAAGDYARSAYNKRGQLIHTWGEAPYPVLYGYDDYGRRTTMTTYQGGSSWGDAAWPGGSGNTTTWVYDDSLDVVLEKIDAASNAVVYTYTADGKLESREWARSSSGSHVTTYTYDDDTGELTDVDYSDAVTPDIEIAYDRLGRRIARPEVSGAGPGAGREPMRWR
jgi:YD repeat-containing protein